MNKAFRAFLSLGTALGLVLGLSACASEPVNLSEVTALIDVRTADEFATAHLQGAVNIDVESSDFAERVAELDKSGKYLIYCHSGRRAGIALEDMKVLGFTDVTNIGGIDEASKLTELPIIYQ